MDKYSYIAHLYIIFYIFITSTYVYHIFFILHMYDHIYLVFCNLLFTLNNLGHLSLSRNTDWSYPISVTSEYFIVEKYIFNQSCINKYL